MKQATNNQWQAYAKGKSGDKRLDKQERKQAREARNWRKGGKHWSVMQ